MKKLTQKHKLYLLRRQKKARKHFAHRRAIKINRIIEVVSIEIPEVFSLRKNYTASLSAINKLRDTVLNKGLHAFVDLSNTKTIGISAALILTVEIYRCRYLRPGRNSQSVTGCYPEDKLVHRILHDVGFFRTLRIKPLDLEDDDFDPSQDILISMQSFVSVDAKKIAAFKDIFTIPFSDLTDQAKRRMQGAILEALLNSMEHAFKADADYDYRVLGRRAWLGGYINVTKREMLIVVFDQGTGIPRTIDPNTIELILSAAKSGRLSPPMDGEIIQIATRLGRTSTGEPNRGKGFKTMRAFVDACTDGELRVYSNKGVFSYDGASEDVAPDAPESLGGTLVTLRIRHHGQEFQIDE